MCSAFSADNNRRDNNCYVKTKTHSTFSYHKSTS